VTEFPENLKYPNTETQLHLLPNVILFFCEFQDGGHHLKAHYYHWV